MRGNSGRRLPGRSLWGDSESFCQLTTALRNTDSALTSQWETLQGWEAGAGERRGEAVGGTRERRQRQRDRDRGEEIRHTQRDLKERLRRMKQTKRGKFREFREVDSKFRKWGWGESKRVRARARGMQARSPVS